MQGLLKVMLNECSLVSGCARTHWHTVMVALLPLESLELHQISSLHFCNGDKSSLLQSPTLVLHKP